MYLCILFKFFSGNYLSLNIKHLISLLACMKLWIQLYRNRNVWSHIYSDLIFRDKFPLNIVHAQHMDSVHIVKLFVKSFEYIPGIWFINDQYRGNAVQYIYLYNLVIIKKTASRNSLWEMYNGSSLNNFF